MTPPQEERAEAPVRDVRYFARRHGIPTRVARRLIEELGAGRKTLRLEAERITGKRLVR